MTKRLIAKKASSSRPFNPGTNFRKEESSGFCAEPAEASSAGVRLVDMLAPLLDDAGFAIIALGPGMQWDRLTRSRFLGVNVFGRWMRLDELIQMVEERFRHPVDDIVADPFSGDQKSRNRKRRDICGLAVIGVGGNGCRDVNRAADLGNHFRRYRDQLGLPRSQNMLHSSDPQSARGDGGIERAVTDHPERWCK